MKRVKEDLLKIIEPFYSDALEKKRQVELAHVAKFVLIRNASLTAMMESPDFVISDSDTTMGVEIRQLLTKRVEYTRYVQKLFDDAAEEFQRHYGERFLANFWLAESFNYVRRDKRKLILEIVDYAHSLSLGEISKQPDFVLRCDLMPHSILSFHYNEGAYFQEQITEAIVLEAIREKEKKIDTYVLNSGTSHQWLLLVNSEIGSESFDTFAFDGLNDVDTRFEHVFLLRDFDFELIQLK